VVLLLTDFQPNFPLTESPPSVIIATRPCPVPRDGTGTIAGTGTTTSRARTGTTSKTTAEKPLFGVLIFFLELVDAQAYLSTQDPAARACARLPPAHVQRRWTPSAQAAPPEGPRPPDRPQQRTRQARPLVGIRPRGGLLSARAKARRR